MKFEPSQVEQKKFELSFRGYNQNQVDEFLKKIGKDYVSKKNNFWC